MTQWQYIPDQHCYSALRGQFGLRVQERNGVWQWSVERLAVEGVCEIIGGSSETRAAALLAATDAAHRSDSKKSLRDIGPTSGKWSRVKLGKRSEASYRIDTQKSGGFLPVIHWRHEQRAEQQSFLPSCDTREEATAEAERILAQLGYQREGDK